MQQPITYNWKRFWYPQGTQVETCYRGYLIDPERNQYPNPKLVELEKLADIPCLVLLGEPGLGKSTELNNLKLHTAEISKNDDDIMPPFSLRSCTNLKGSLFENEQFIDWKNGQHRLYLFLDSLDESSNIQVIGKQLVDILGSRTYRDKLNRLYIRLACRDAIFPAFLTEGLKGLYGESYAAYKLGNLRSIDVERSAERNFDKPQKFISDIEENNLTYFARKPITLKVLFNLYRQDKNISRLHTITDIYLAGCQALCDEDPEHPKRPGIGDNLELAKRLTLAGRIAVVTVLSGRNTVWVGRSGEQDFQKDIEYHELAFGYEATNEVVFEAKDRLVHEVLETGLFIREESYQRGWTHRTYAEFLAAWYLDKCSLSSEQILNFILHPDGHVIPQLQAVTAWLANMRSEIFQKIVEIDPDVLVQSDITNNSTRSKLVDSILELHNQGSLRYLRALKYLRLNHPKLSDKLNSFILEPTKNKWSKMVAIDIIESCHLKESQDTLLRVARNSKHPYEVRQWAARVICKIGNETTKEQLKPLVLGQGEDDPGDELKGYGLRAVWPKHISVQELLENISQPQEQGSVGGTYQNFLTQEFLQNLAISDLPIVLQWLANLPTRHELGYPFRGLSDSIMQLAWQNFDQPDVHEVFTSVAILRLRKSDSIFGNRPSSESSPFINFDSDETRDDQIEPLLRESSDKRRHLIKAIVASVDDSGPHHQLPWLIEIISSEDILWLIEQVKLSEACEANTQQIWIKLLRYFPVWKHPYSKNIKYIDSFLEGCQANSAMYAEFKDQITPIELNSKRATELQAAYFQEQNLIQQYSQVSQLELPPKQRVIEALEKVEAGCPDLWWQVCVAMTLTPTSIDGNYDLDSVVFTTDITTLPGWIEAEENTTKRIIKSAKNYLSARDLKTLGIISKSNLSHPLFAGYQAIYCVEKQEPEFVSTLSIDTWIKWIPSVLRSISPSNVRRPETDEITQRIIKTAYSCIPEQFIEALITLILQWNYQPQKPDCDDDIYRSTSQLLDQPIASIILEKIPEEDLTAGILDILFKDFFQESIEQATSTAVSFIPTSIPNASEERNKAVVASRMLLLYGDGSSWPTLWSAIQQDISFGCEVFESVALQAVYEGGVEQNLHEDHVADLYIFLVQQYPDISPTSNETKSREPTGVKARVSQGFDTVQQWRRYIPQHLQARGTEEACKAFRKIMQILPEQKNNLQLYLLATENLLRRNTWHPPTPKDILTTCAMEAPSKAILSTVDEINQRTIKMEKEPKSIDNSVRIGGNNSGNVNIGNNNEIDTKINDSPSKTEKTSNWQFWASISVAIFLGVATLIATIFANDLRNIFPKSDPLPSVESSKEEEKSQRDDLEVEPSSK
ncbi:MAG: hypothetical protein AAF579_04920 [Cyanobacteria bacterium P01_C01_bin.118]